MLAVFERDFRAFWDSPVGYVFVADFLLICNLFFYLNNVLCTVRESRVLFFSSPSLISDGFLTTSNLMNRQYLSCVLSYLYGQEESVLVEPREMLSEQLTITGFAAKVLFTLLVVALPLGILLLGLWRWRKRSVLQ